jgi:hypothetical protein
MCEIIKQFTLKLSASVTLLVVKRTVPANNAMLNKHGDALQHAANASIQYASSINTCCLLPSSSQVSTWVHHQALNTHKRTSNTRRKSKKRELTMDYYYLHTSSNTSSKEKRPPLKRGQLKWQIARTISSLVVPRNAAAGSREKHDRSGSFGRGPSYNG